MAEKPATIKQTKILSDLSSDKLDLALSALILLEKDGRLAIIPQLFEIYKKQKNTEVKKKILEFVSNIEIIRLIEEEVSPFFRQEFLTIIWNSKLDFSAHLADIVSIAVHGDFMQALDCLTIIENMSGPFEEHQLLESQLYLKDYLDNRNNEETEKNQFISEIASYIKEQNEGVDADLLFE
jgi:hypothetical protein